MTTDRLRYPLALFGGIAFAFVLFITIQALLLRPATPTKPVQSALLLERVQLHQPAPAPAPAPQTPPPPVRPPQPLASATPAQASPSAALNLGAASPLQDPNDLNLALPQHGGQAWGAVDSSLVILSRSEPVYPPTAARRGVEGWVRLQFTVNAEGRVQDAAVVAAQPPNLFDRAALQAVQQWRFKPRRVNGQTVATPVVQTLSFRLDT